MKNNRYAPEYNVEKFPFMVIRLTPGYLTYCGSEIIDNRGEIIEVITYHRTEKSATTTARSSQVKGYKRTIIGEGKVIDRREGGAA